MPGNVLKGIHRNLRSELFELLIHVLPVQRAILLDDLVEAMLLG